MAVLVTGSAGQLGAEICGQLGPRAVGIDVDSLDLTDRDALRAFLLRIRPELIVNCAAYTAVDEAEKEPQRCRAVNVDAVETLVEACAVLDCPLVQISTDYVFGGAAGLGRPYREDDAALPQGVYATTKFDAERVAARHPKHLIVRTCGLYARPSNPRAGNFVKTVLRLARTKVRLRVVNDQRCTPSYVPHVARAVAFLAGIDRPGPAPWGIYHVTNTGEANWHEFAEEVLRQAGVRVRIDAITTAQYHSLAPRPAYSVLDTTAYHRLGGPPMPDWRAALAEYFVERRKEQSGGLSQSSR